ncbi:M23 family metallopeptidase [Flavobacteriales bacterium]|nr:M23 family metallopeptidase [Flavobacteriales bacterium]
MEQKSFKNKIVNFFNKNFRLVVINDETLEEEGFLKLNRLNIIILASVLLISAFVISFCIIVYSPLNKHLPGKSSELVQKELVKLTLKSDSLASALSISSLYLSNIESIIKGDSISFEYLDDSLNKIDNSDFNFIKSKEDSLLRLRVEKEDQSSINLNSARRTKQFLFFPPIEGIVSDSFNLETNHYGIDLVAKTGSRIKSIGEGTVVVSDWNPQTGYVIGIQHSENFISFYKHCSVLLKNVGDVITTGEQIAIIGNSGELSTGPHLHFELWKSGTPLDPSLYISF